MAEEEELFERRKYLQLFLTTFCFISIYFYAWLASFVHVGNLSTYSTLDVSTYSTSVSLSLLLTHFCFIYGIISALDTHHFLPWLAVVSAPIIVFNSISLYINGNISFHNNGNISSHNNQNISSYNNGNYSIIWPLVIGIFIGSVYTIFLYLLHKEVKTYENYLRLSPKDSVWIDSVVIYSREDANQNSTKIDPEVNWKSYEDVFKERMYKYIDITLILPVNYIPLINKISWLRW